MEFLSIVFAVVLAPILYLAYVTTSKPKNFPPGPISIPFIGNMHLLGSKPHITARKLAKKYGNVFGLKFATRDVIYVHGYEANKEVLITKGKEFAGRPFHAFIIAMREGSSGIGINDYGPTWSINRKIFQTVIRGKGGSGETAEEIIKQEASYLIKEIENLVDNGELIELSKIFSISIINVISSFLFHERYQYGEEKAERLAILIGDFFRITRSWKSFASFISIAYPLTNKIYMPKFTRDFRKCQQAIIDYCDEEVKRHERTLDMNCARDLIDEYLIKMNEAPINEGYSRTQLCTSLLDLFQAGVDTTTASLLWAMLLLSEHQHVQRRMQEEIVRVIGMSQEAKYGDRIKMPYTEATIHEITRYCTVTPNGVSHSPMKDVELFGYTIPKGTMVWIDVYSSNFQEEKWKKPYEFYPENFLNEDGQFQNNEAHMSFSGGPRICVGMQLAKQELFLLLVNIFQKFDVKLENDNAEVNYETIGSAVVYPAKSNKYRFTKRG